MLSIDRGLSLQKMDKSHKMVGFVEDVELWDKNLVNAKVTRAMLLKERDNARNKLRKACDEVGIMKDEIEDLKLELEIVNKDMEARIEQAFKKSEEIDRLKGMCWAHTLK